MTAKGTLYTIAAPSGAGKTSLVRALVAQLPGTEVSVSHTTRPPRPGETDGSDYYFVDAAQFEALIARQAFLEHARVFGHDHYYGTSRAAVVEKLDSGIDVILEIDWQGARLVREQMPECHSIFILPPSKNALQQRLQHRGQDSAAVIGRRMATAVREISHFHEFDYLIVNDDFDQALDALRAIFVAYRHRREAETDRRSELIASLLGNGDDTMLTG